MASSLLISSFWISAVKLALSYYSSNALIWSTHCFFSAPIYLHLVLAFYKSSLSFWIYSEDWWVSCWSLASNYTLTWPYLASTCSNKVCNFWIILSLLFISLWWSSSYLINKLWSSRISFSNLVLSMFYLSSRIRSFCSLSRLIYFY